MTEVLSTTGLLWPFDIFRSPGDITDSFQREIMKEAEGGDPMSDERDGKVREVGGQATWSLSR